MFSKINFTYKSRPQTSKNYLILKEQIIKQKIIDNEKNSIINCINTKNKIDPKKVQNASDVFIESSYTTKNIDNINTNITIKLNHSSSINTEMINDINNPEIILTPDLINNIEKNRGLQNKLIDNLIQPSDKGKKDIDSTFSIIYNNNNNMLNNEDLFHDNIPNPFNVGRIKNRGIQTLNNVYQSKYFSGKVNSTGLGDFIRGCYFILEFCYTYNFQPKIIFNNVISKFLKIKTHNLDIFENILKTTQFFEYNNVNHFNFQSNTNIILEPIKDTKNIMANFVDFVVKQQQYNGNIFMLCNCYPINEVSETAKQYMRKILEPTNEMNDIIQQTMTQLSISTKKYNVIHIRSGDSYLINKNSIFNNSYINKLIANIKQVVSNDINSNYLLIADNNDVKNIIKTYFPNFKTLNKPITHFGEGVVLEEEKVKNTLIDFYLLSHSNNIFSYSSYKHGSGFSYWCAKTYNIPYICKFIE